MNRHRRRSNESRERHKARVRRLVDEVMKGNDLDLVDELRSPALSPSRIEC